MVVEIRELGVNGATHRFSAVPVDGAGTFASYMFSLDTNTIGTFPGTPIGSGNIQLVFQIQSGYSTNGTPTQTDLRVDNILIEAVPEPSTGILCLGALGLSITRRRR